MKTQTSLRICGDCNWKVPWGERCPNCGGAEGEPSTRSILAADTVSARHTSARCPACGSASLKRLGGKKVARAFIFAPALLGVVGKKWECRHCGVRF